jgi:hypothetical protein
MCCCLVERQWKKKHMNMHIFENIEKKNPVS